MVPDGATRWSAWRSFAGYALRVAVELSRDDVVAHRLAVHHLSRRLPWSRMLEAAAACGLQDSPPGSAFLSLAARAEDVTAEALDLAVGQDRTLVRTWSLRGAPFLVPTRDLAVFTTGVLLPTAEGRRRLVMGVGPSLDRLGLTIDEAVDLVRAELHDVLSGRRLTITELGVEIATRITPHLTPAQQALWEAEGPYATGQPLGEGVVHFCLRLLTLEQVLLLAPREGRRAPFVLTDEWLPHRPAELDPAAARGELLRRHLRCHGPTTRLGFATWLGVRPGDTAAWWAAVGDEVTEVEVDGRRGWMLTDDLREVGRAERPTGVRLLPARDAYTQAGDRSLLLAPAHHRALWRGTGDPGALLVDGELVGTWRPRKQGRRLTLRVTLFTELTARQRHDLDVEARGVAALRGADVAQVSFAGGPDQGGGRRGRGALPGPT